jgi:hypothetical protein
LRLSAAMRTLRRLRRRSGLKSTWVFEFTNVPPGGHG